MLSVPVRGFDKAHPQSKKLAACNADQFIGVYFILWGINSILVHFQTATLSPDYRRRNSIHWGVARGSRVQETDSQLATAEI